MLHKRLISFSLSLVFVSGGVIVAAGQEIAPLGSSPENER